MNHTSNGGRTDIGRIRDHNEDAFGIDEDQHVFLVADGLGGHDAGEVASRLAVTTVLDFFEALYVAPDGPGDGSFFAHAIRAANRQVYDSSATTGSRRMGTTLVGMHLEGYRFTLAHVGDSRAYRLRNGELEPLTRDHCLGNAMIDAGFTPDEAAELPNQNALVRAVGTKSRVEMEVQRGAWEPGDVYLLCTDGLTNMIDDRKLHALALWYRNDPQTLADALIDRANDAGGRDNVTCVVVRIPDDRIEPYRPVELPPVAVAA